MLHVTGWLSVTSQPLFWACVYRREIAKQHICWWNGIEQLPTYISPTRPEMGAAFHFAMAHNFILLATLASYPRILITPEHTLLLSPL